MKSVFIACLGTETNTFAPVPTGLASFEELGSSRRDGSVLNPKGIGGFLRAFRRLIEADGRSVIESICAFAEPGGITVQSTYERLRGQLLGDLAEARDDIGFVIFAMHGAMIASGCDDCEGDLIARAREIVGPDIPIGVELDPHCHLTDQMVENADAIVIMKEYPHIDWGDRAAELYKIVASKVAGRAQPVSAVFDCRMVGFYPTMLEPMAGLVRRFKEAEAEPGILSVSFVHGFPWGDQAENGSKILVIADGDRAKAEELASRLGRAVYALRDELLPKLPAIDEALALAASLPGRVVLADTADNAGAGAPGDTTYLLRGMIDAGVGPAAYGTIYDPSAVRVCEEAGVGARLLLRVGGKLGPTSGDPLDVEVEVMALSPDHVQNGRATTRMGASAWVRIGDIDVVIASIRAQVFGPSVFTNIGIDLDGKRVVAVKSLEHFRAEFAPIADHIIAVGTPGAIQMNFASLPYTRKRDLDYHPRVSDPLGSGASVR